MNGCYVEVVFHFVAKAILFLCFFGFDVPTSSFIFIENVFLLFLICKDGPKTKGRPCISIASCKLKPLLIYTDKLKYAYNL